MYCRNCGQVLKDDAAFCGNCGTPVMQPGRINSIGDAVRAALNGNNDGFTYLYDKTYKAKYYVAQKYVKNDDTVADVLQDAYMKAFQNLNMLNDPEKFDSWLGMIVANTAKNYLRVKNPVLFSEMDHDDGEGDITEFQDLIVDERIDFNPEERYSKQETADLVNELLSSLPEEQKICMIMFYLEGHSVDEIATALECSKNTVTSRLNYGRKKIKAKGEELEKRGYRLYSVSPVVLLFILMQLQKRSYIYEAGAAAAGAAGVASGAVSSGSASGASSAGSVAVSGTTGTGYAGAGSGASGVNAAAGGVGSATAGAAAGAAGSGSSVSALTAGAAVSKVAAVSGSTAAKAGIFSTIAGKVAVTAASVVLVGGLTVGTVTLVNSNKDDKDTKNETVTGYIDDENGSSSQYAGGSDSTASDIFGEDNGKTETASSESGFTKVSADETLRDYLETDLIPKYNIYDPSQTTIEVFDTDCTVTGYTFNPDTLTLEAYTIKNYGPEESDSWPTLADYPYDYSGICEAKIEDFDNDGISEMLVIRRNDKTELGDEPYTYEYYEFTAELYECDDDDEVTITASAKLYPDIDHKQRIDDIYLMSQNGEKYIVAGYIYETMSLLPYQSYFSVYSVKDLTPVKYLYGERKATGAGGAQTLYITYVETDGSGTVTSTEDAYNYAEYELDDENGIISNLKYLKNRGFVGDDAELLFRKSYETDISIKYLFGADPDRGKLYDNLFSVLGKNTISFITGNGRGGTELSFPDDEHISYREYYMSMMGDGSEAKATADISELKRPDRYTISFKTANSAGDAANALNGEYIILMPGAAYDSLKDYGITYDILTFDQNLNGFSYEDIVDSEGRLKVYIIYKTADTHVYIAPTDK